MSKSTVHLRKIKTSVCDLLFAGEKPVDRPGTTTTAVWGGVAVRALSRLIPVTTQFLRRTGQQSSIATSFATQLEAVEAVVKLIQRSMVPGESNTSATRDVINKLSLPENDPITRLLFRLSDAGQIDDQLIELLEQLFDHKIPDALQQKTVEILSRIGNDLLKQELQEPNKTSWFRDKTDSITETAIILIVQRLGRLLKFQEMDLLLRFLQPGVTYPLVLATLDELAANLTGEVRALSDSWSKRINELLTATTQSSLHQPDFAELVLIASAAPLVLSESPETSHWLPELEKALSGIGRDLLLHHLEESHLPIISRNQDWPSVRPILASTLSALKAMAFPMIVA